MAPDLEACLGMARAYCDLGWSVQEQLHELAIGERRPGLFNPESLALIRERYLPALRACNDDAASELEHALLEAEEFRLAELAHGREG